MTCRQNIRPTDCGYMILLQFCSFVGIGVFNKIPTLQHMHQFNVIFIHLPLTWTTIQRNLSFLFLLDWRFLASLQRNTGKKWRKKKGDKAGTKCWCARGMEIISVRTTGRLQKRYVRNYLKSTEAKNVRMSDVLLHVGLFWFAVVWKCRGGGWCTSKSQLPKLFSNTQR